VVSRNQESCRSWLVEDSFLRENGSMETTIDIPEKALKDAMRFAGTTIKRKAILAAVEDFNGRHRMAALTRHLGTCEDLMSVGELKHLRSEG
jgi:Arc/MetJ family transcription regulator